MVGWERSRAAGGEGSHGDWVGEVWGSEGDADDAASVQPGWRGVGRQRRARW